MRIGFEWLEEGESKNYVEIFDEYIFAHKHDIENLPIEHELYKPNGRLYANARCLLSIRGKNISLNYEEFHKINQDRGLLIGITEFIYDPSQEEKINAVRWKDLGTTEFLECSIKFVSRKTKLSTLDKSDDLMHELVDEADRLSDDDLNRLLPPAGSLPPRKVVTTSVYVRNPFVVVAALRRASGHCECCKSDAPFRKLKDNEPYLEVHHISPLFKGGSDDLENVIALCPNCHRKFHYGSEV
jgi:hypothetical protein